MTGFLARKLRRVSRELLVLCTWEVLLSQVGKAGRMLTGGSARKLCVRWTLEVSLQEENVKQFLNIPVGFAEKLVL